MSAPSDGGGSASNYEEWVGGRTPPPRSSLPTNAIRPSCNTLEEITAYLGWSPEREAAEFNGDAKKIAAERERTAQLPDPARIAWLIRRFKKLNTVSVTEAAGVWGMYPAQLLNIIERGLVPAAEKTIAGRQYRIRRDAVYRKKAHRP